MVIVDNEIVLQSINRTEMYIHPVPCYLLQLFGIHLIVQYPFLTFINYFFTNLLTFLCHFLFCIYINSELIPTQPFQLFMFFIFLQQMFELFSYFSNFCYLLFLFLFDGLFHSFSVVIFNYNFIIFYFI